MTKKEFEKKYNLIAPSEDILHNKVPMFDMNNPPVDPQELGLDLLKHMRYFGGIGLSANQLGLPYRVFVMEGDPGFVCFNPRITAYAGEDVMLDEGCLTYPGLYVKKKRPNLIRCRFIDPLGNTCVKKFTGMTARIFQHEIEHLEGENFLEGIGDFALRRAKEKQTKLLEKVRRQKNKLVRQQNKK
jgi:peptide deformylase